MLKEEPADQGQRLLETSNFSQQVHKGVHSPVVIVEPGIISKIYSSNAALLIHPVLEESDGLYLWKPVLDARPYLYELVFEVNLPVHHVHIGFLLSVTLKVEEDRVVQEVAHRLVIALKVKECVNECKTEEFWVEVCINLARGLACDSGY